MDQFPSSEQLCSWAGICPGDNRSGGKSRAAHIKKANTFLLVALVEAGWGASRTRGTKFEAQFHRWSRKGGKKRALIAICHSLLRTIYLMLREQKTYCEPDPKVTAERERTRQIKHHVKRLRELGMSAEACQQITEELMRNTPLPPTPTTIPLEYTTSQRPPQPCRGALGFRARVTRPQRTRKYGIVKDQ